MVAELSLLEAKKAMNGTVAAVEGVTVVKIVFATVTATETEIKFFLETKLSLLIISTMIEMRKQ